MAWHRPTPANSFLTNRSSLSSNGDGGQDLQGIYDFIATESLQYPGLVADHIIGAVGRLDRFPESGRIVPELNRSEVREVLWRSYRIVYRLIRQDQAQVLAVFRSERLFPDLRNVGGPA